MWIIKWMAALALSIAVTMIFISCGTGAGSGSGSGGITGSVGAENVLLTSAQMLTDGFSYGPIDGTLGAIYNAGTYTLFGSGYKTTGGTQGAFAFTGSLTSITGSNLTPLIAVGGDPNSYDFDKNYSGGGPVIPLYNGLISVGYLMAYHGEYWCTTANGCSNSNSGGGSPNFYSGLGLAYSANGTTFTKMGQVVQPYPTRASIFVANTNLEVGGGAMMIGDVNGNYIPNFATLANKASAYIYIFFSDRDLTNTVSPCSTGVHCVGVARASYNSVVNAATGNHPNLFPTLFQKYYQGSFAQAATSSGNDQTTNSGDYTAVVADSSPLYPSVVYVSNISEFLMTYSTGNNQINFVTGTNLLSWSGNITPMQINQSGWTMLEPSLIGESTDPLTSNGSPYVYYVKANNWIAQNWRSANYVMRQVTY